MKIRLGFLLLLSLGLPAISVAHQFHITPSGSALGAGSINSPWDIQTALNHPNQVVAGDTFWLHDGVYSGNFTSNLNGAPNNYIYVLQYPNERAKIEDNRATASGGTLQINGSWTIYKDFEVCNSNTTRTSGGDHSFRPMGLQVNAPNTKFINLIIHDTGHGFGFWKEAIDAEIYGCLIYNCGTANSPGVYSTHGHGIYSQNNSGVKKIKHNLIFNQFGFGLHIYPNPGNISGYLIDGNTLFNNGRLTRDTIRYNNIIVNTYSPYACENISIVNNNTYDNRNNYVYTALIEADIYLGSTIKSKNLVVENNNFFGKGRAGMAILNWDTVKFNNNQTYYLKNGTVGLAIPNGTSTSAYTWNNNDYFGGSNNNQFSYQYGLSTTFTNWKTNTSFDGSSNFYSTAPSLNKTIIQSNEYETGRAQVIVYNWENKSNIDIDLSTIGLQDGQTFKVVDAANYFGSPLVTDIYDVLNPVTTINISSMSTAAAVGLSSLPSTAPEFITLIVLPSTLPTAIASLENKSARFKIYPNPSTEKFTIEYELNEPATLKIIDVLGKVILEENVWNSDTKKQQKSIDVQSFDKGIYFIQLVSDHGEMMEKVVVE